MTSQSLQQPGRTFRQKIDDICGPDNSCLWDWSVEPICDAIRVIYNELPDDDWPRYYLVQHVFQARAMFLASERFKDFLKEYEAFNDDFIDEVAWDSKLWEWKKANRGHLRATRGRGRGRGGHFSSK